MVKKLYVFTVSSMLLFSSNIMVAAKGNTVHIKDVNRNHIDDAWEKKYGFKKKGFENQDTDRDGLTNYYEYTLKLNPKSADTDRDNIVDGDEDFDKDGVSNAVEVINKTQPNNPDSDHDGKLDGDEDSNGDKIPDKNELKEIELEIKVIKGSKIKLEYEYEKKKEKYKLSSQISLEQAKALISSIKANPSLTNEELDKLVREQLGLSAIDSIKCKVKYGSGKQSNKDHQPKHNEDDHKSEPDDHDNNDQEDGN